MSEFYKPYPWERKEAIAERLVDWARRDCRQVIAIMEPVRMYANPGDTIEFVVMRFDRDRWRQRAEYFASLLARNGVYVPDEAETV